MTTKPTLGPADLRLSPEDSSVPRSSVPVSVYRALARELQATRGRVDVLQAQNNRLVKHNRQLRQEIEKVVERGKHLDRVLQTLDETRESHAPSFVIPTRSRIVTPPGRSPRDPGIPTEIQPAPAFSADESPKKPYFNAIGITLAVLVVVLTSGFGAFWLVSSTKR